MAVQGKSMARMQIAESTTSQVTKDTACHPAVEDSYVSILGIRDTAIDQIVVIRTSFKARARSAMPREMERGVKTLTSALTLITMEEKVMVKQEGV